jgi:hypothetical protein
MPRGRRLGIGVTTEWCEKGACRPDRLPLDVLPEFFFADLSMRMDDRLKAAAAKGVCQHCIIRVECLEFAIRHCEDGIWGGLDGRERSNLTGVAARRRRLQEVVEHAGEDERQVHPRSSAG